MIDDPFDIGSIESSAAAGDISDPRNKALEDLRRNPLLELLLRQICESLEYVVRADDDLRSGKRRGVALIAIIRARHRLAWLANFLDGGNRDG